MYNAHAISHYAARVDRLSALAHNIRGNLGLYMHTQQLVSEARRGLNALTAESAPKVAPKPIDADEQAGFDAFPAGRWMDAMRGTKSFPDEVRCPFKRPERVAAWTRGYEAALASLTDRN